MIKLYGMDIWWISPDDLLPENNGNLCAVVVKGPDDTSFGLGISSGDEIWKHTDRVLGWLPLPDTSILFQDEEEDTETAAG